MSYEKDSIRFNWIKGMYLYTIFGAGGFGLGIIFFPDVIAKILGIPNANPFFWGITASIYTAFGIFTASIISAVFGVIILTAGKDPGT